MLPLLALSTICLVNGELVGPVIITENGEKVTRYAVSVDANLEKTDGSSIILQHGNDAQIQIAANASNTYSPYIFQEYKLTGKTLSFTANLSSIGCSCNAAVYFTTIPGYGSDGKPNPGGQGDYYCAANGGNGEFCWELDILEANKYALQVTPHTCKQNPGGYITSCDGIGCGTNTFYVNSKGFGPGTDYIINTLNPFIYSILFTGTSMNVTLTQGSNNIL
eukprot:103412_1